MRISDWSSDVCSSDLVAVVTQEKRTKRPLNTQDFPHFHLCFARREHMVGKKPARRVPDMQLDQIAFSRRVSQDRQSVASGKRVAGSVDLGSRRILKKPKTYRMQYTATRSSYNT